MSKSMVELLKGKLPKHGDEEAIELVSVFDSSANKVYLQTNPYIKDGRVVVKRVCEVDVTIEKAYQIVEEYELTTTYEKKSD